MGESGDLSHRVVSHRHTKFDVHCDKLFNTRLFDGMRMVHVAEFQGDVRYGGRLCVLLTGTLYLEWRTFALSDLALPR